MLRTRGFSPVAQEFSWGVSGDVLTVTQGARRTGVPDHRDRVQARVNSGVDSAEADCAPSPLRVLVAACEPGVESAVPALLLESYSQPSGRQPRHRWPRPSDATRQRV